MERFGQPPKNAPLPAGSAATAGKNARERVDDAVHEIAEVVTADLPVMVIAVSVSTERFERIVLDVLRHLCYGALKYTLQTENTIAPELPRTDSSHPQDPGDCCSA